MISLVVYSISMQRSCKYSFVFVIRSVSNSIARIEQVVFFKCCCCCHRSYNECVYLHCLQVLHSSLGLLLTLLSFHRASFNSRERIANTQNNTEDEFKKTTHTHTTSSDSINCYMNAAFIATHTKQRYHITLYVFIYVIHSIYITRYFIRFHNQHDSFLFHSPHRIPFAGVLVRLKE